MVSLSHDHLLTFRSMDAENPEPMVEKVNSISLSEANLSNYFNGHRE